MWGAILSKIVLMALIPVHAEVLDVQKFPGLQLVIKHDLELARGNSALDLADNSANINYCFMHASTLAQLPARLILTVDDVENNSGEATINTHTGDGADVSLTCMIFGQAEIEDVRQALNPSLDVLSPELAQTTLDIPR